MRTLFPPILFSVAAAVTGACLALAVGPGLAPGRIGPTHAQDEIPDAPPAPGRIVYTRQDSEDSTAFDMFTSDADGSNEVKLSAISESIAGEFQPRWSPDGERIVFATGHRDTGHASYWLIDHDGGEPVRVVENDGRGKDPAWSPDGRCFAFSGAHGAGASAAHNRFDIKVWCEGEGVTTLTDTPDIDERDPDWSPDGERILYVARHVDPPDERTERFSLHTMNADGTDPQLILDWWGSHERAPRWSPDGERIAFIVSDNAEWVFGTLHVFAPESGEIQAILRKPAASISWSPDGQSLVFSNVDDAGITRLGGSAEAAALLRLGELGELGGRDTRGELDPLGVRPAAQIVQNKGLYLYHLAERGVARLKGHAGGRNMDDFEYGYAPDWTAGTATPTPLATSTFTPSPSPEATDTSTPGTPTVSATRRSTATPTLATEITIHLPYADAGAR